MYGDCVVISVARCMFRPNIVAIFMNVFFEGCVIWSVKKYTNVKCCVVGKRIKIYTYVYIYIQSIKKLNSVA
jgi:hypothetical protein